jgi:hypothetical protein
MLKAKLAVVQSGGCGMVPKLIGRYELHIFHYSCVVHYPIASSDSILS